MTKYERTDGLNQLVSMLTPKGALSRCGVAKVLGISRTVFARWESAQCRPVMRLRYDLEAHYGIPASAWDLPNEKEARKRAERSRMPESGEAAE